MSKLAVNQLSEANLRLRQAMKEGSREKCVLARDDGAMIFITMIKDAASTGRLDLCLLGIEWQIEACKKQGAKSDIASLMNIMAFSAAKNMQSEVLEYSLRYIESHSTAEWCFWGNLSFEICLSGNVQWCHKMKSLITEKVKDTSDMAALMCGAKVNVEICDFVFEILGENVDRYEFKCRISELIEKGTAEMFFHFVEIGKKLFPGFNIASYGALAAEFGRIDILRKWDNFTVKERGIGYLARIGCFDLCRDKIALLEGRIDWLDIAINAVKYPGDSEFCTYAIDMAVRDSLDCDRDKNIVWLTFNALPSKNRDRINYLISLHSNRQVLYTNIVKSGNLRLVFKYMSPFLGDIFPNFTEEYINRNIDKYIPKYSVEDHIQDFDWYSWQRAFAKIKPIFDYCEKFGICREFREKFLKAQPFIVNLDIVERDLHDIPSQAL